MGSSHRLPYLVLPRVWEAVWFSMQGSRQFHEGVPDLLPSSSSPQLAEASFICWRLATLSPSIQPVQTNLDPASQGRATRDQGSFWLCTRGTASLVKNSQDWRSPPSKKVFIERTQKLTLPPSPAHSASTFLDAPGILCVHRSLVLHSLNTLLPEQYRTWKLI